MAPATKSGQKAALEKSTNESPATLRRSTRARKATRPFEQGENTRTAMAEAEVRRTTPPQSPEEQSVGSPLTPAESPEVIAPVRRNPKRKGTPEVFDIPSRLLERSLETWNENELEEWPSWAEVESDPVG